jgi:hypothetical protein
VSWSKASAFAVNSAAEDSRNEKSRSQLREAQKRDFSAAGLLPGWLFEVFHKPVLGVRARAPQLEM